MKKIKKILLLLLAFSFTTLLFNSQAYAVEYYTFEFTVTDVSNKSDVQYTPITLYGDLKSFLIAYGNNDGFGYISYGDEQAVYLYYYVDEQRLGYVDILNGWDLVIFSDLHAETDYSDGIIPVGTYTFTTDILITFTKTFWDQIIDVIGDIAVAFQAAASAGISLIYDGTALTSLGEIITITLGVGLVIGLFYLVIRVLPGARL